MTYPTIAVALIVKGTDDEAPMLAKALGSINTHVDAIFIDINAPKGKTVSSKVRAVAKQYGAHIKETIWTGNFSKARNELYERVPRDYEFIMWMDSDDTIDNPDAIRPLLAVVSPLLCGIYIKYDYDHDEFGNVTTTHWVCRISRNNGSYIWKSSLEDGEVSVHETLVEARQVPKTMSNDFKVIHHSDVSRRINSLQRNIGLLESMYKNQNAKKAVDPRILFYLGTHYFDARRFGDAKFMLQNYLQLSGWNEERSEALVYLGNILEYEEKPDAAKQAYANAVIENPSNPRPYIELGQVEFKLKRFKLSARFLELAVAVPEEKTTTVLRPMENTFRAFMLLAQAYVNMGGKELEKAKKNIEKALKIRPLDPDAQGARDIIDKIIDIRDTVRAAQKLIGKFSKENEEGKITRLLEMLPMEVQDNPTIVKIRNQYTLPKKWGKKSLVIYAGQGPIEKWGPWSLEEGIGGSEEAIIRLSKELVAQGWSVTVYATPGAEDGVYDGVVWKNYWEFNANDTFDVLVAWRSPWFFDMKFKARKSYLWLHDVMDKEEFTPERLANLDKCIFVSEYHSNLYADTIPKKKRFASGNGIDPSEFEAVDGRFKRQAHRAIYMSSHTRGLKQLYEIWPDVLKEIPDAKLDVYYGWESYDAVNKDNPERMAWKNDLIKQGKKLKGVTDHGKVGQDQIVEEINKANVFAYPCIFPEVYCISLIKAMAGGAYPVTSDFAVLKDFNQKGTQVSLGDNKNLNLKAYTKELIKQLKNPVKDREEMKRWARDVFSWEKTAEGWKNEFEL
jgi:glycosyltransferase involved in cell wall biosynthesis/Tfp pilus assembly protein PilF